MTPQEQQLIDGLVQRIRSTPAAQKDDEADSYLHQQLDSAPDALYVLAQTVLVQQYGLQNAQTQLQQANARIQSLEAQLGQAQQQAAAPSKKSGSFLSHLLGTDEPEPPRAPAPSGFQPVNTGYATPPPAPPYGYPAAGYATQPAGVPVSGGGGFLRGALQTAAGVAAGEMFFQGMEGLFHGFGGGGYGGGRPEVIENNYYNDDRGEHEHRADSSDSGNFYNPSDDASRQGLSPDIEDRRGFADTSTDDTTADNTDYGTDDDSSQAFDDGGGFGDSGGMDDNGGMDDGGGFGGDDNSF